MVETIEEVLSRSDVVVIGNGSPEFADAIGRRREDQTIIDLVRVDNGKSADQGYEGICW